MDHPKSDPSVVRTPPIFHILEYTVFKIPCITASPKAYHFHLLVQA